MGTALAPYAKVDNPVAFAIEMAESVAALVQCDVRQGRAIAMTCLCENITPLDFLRRYHLIQGKPTMRADAMLAEFRMNFGGDYEIVERTPEAAAINLIDAKGRKVPFRFTWDDAIQSRWPWAKGKGPLARDAKDREPTLENLKDNWSTPTDRKQLLWARCVSDGLRAVCPELVSGVYTPEEIGDVIEGEVIPSAAPRPSAAQVMAEQAAAAAAASNSIAAADGDDVTEAEFEVKAAATQLSNSDPGSITDGQSLEVQQLMNTLFGEKAKEALDTALAKRNAQVLRNLSRDQADELLGKLRDKARVEASAKN